jgi:ABC-2 type transport system permease protein
MLRLLKIEWLKIRKHSGFWVYMGLSLLTILVMAFVMYRLFGTVQENRILEQGKSMLTGSNNFVAFPKIWHTFGYLFSFTNIFIGLFIISNNTNEYSYRTSRQNIIDGLSKKEFFTAKLLVILIVSIAATLIYILITLLTALAVDASSLKYMFEGTFKYVWGYFLQVILYCSIAFFFAQVFRKFGIAFVLYFAYTLIVDEIIAAFLNEKIAKGAGNYLFIEAGDSLTAKAFSENFNDFNPYGGISSSMWWVLVGVAIIYIVAFNFFNNYIYKKRDL